MSLDFGKHMDVIYERPPLRSVLCQVRFPAVLSLLTPAGITGFQTALRNEYPDFDGGVIDARIGSDGRSLAVQALPPVWRLSDVSGAWTVCLATDFVALESTAYTGIDAFLDRLLRVLHVLQHTVRPAATTRVGFRKINVIEVPSLKLEALAEIIRAELLGPAAATNLPAEVCDLASRLAFQDEDNRLQINYGIVESDQVSMGFGLDLDYFTDRPHAVEHGEEICDLLRHFSDGMTSFFHWAVVPQYLEKLGPRSRQSQGTEK